MKFIIDAQLPISLSILLKSKGHDSIHTLDFEIISRLMEENSLIEITKNGIIVHDENT